MCDSLSLWNWKTYWLFLGCSHFRCYTGLNFNPARVFHLLLLQTCGDSCWTGTRRNGWDTGNRFRSMIEKFSCHSCGKFWTDRSVHMNLSFIQLSSPSKNFDYRLTATVHFNIIFFPIFMTVHADESKRINFHEFGWNDTFFLAYSPLLFTTNINK